MCPGRGWRGLAGRTEGGPCRCSSGVGRRAAATDPAISMCPLPSYFLPGCYLGMTVPVLNEIRLTKEGTELEREVVTAYYLPGEFQQNPPVPMDPEVRITERAPLRVITR